MGESEIAAFRERFRIDLIERLALKTALGAPVLAQALSIEDSRDSLTAWLDEDAKRAVEAYGKHFQDPGLTALYADEVQEVIERMKDRVQKVADELKQS
jgi:hypothetical protein